MSDIQPYTLSIPEEALSNLSEKLSTASFPDELDGAGWDYGAPLADIKRLTVYWKEKFSWRDAERKINELPNYKTTIEVDGFDPLSIHFVHQKSKNDAAIPLLFVHGCILSLFIQHTMSSQKSGPYSFLTLHRAGTLSRSIKTPAPPRSLRQHFASLPCRGPFSPELWLLPRCEAKRLRHRSVCRDMPQTDAEARIPRVCDPRRGLGK